MRRRFEEGGAVFVWQSLRSGARRGGAVYTYLRAIAMASGT